MNSADIQIARDHIKVLSSRNKNVPALFERTGHALYESDGGVVFAVKKDAPDVAHALASTAAQGDSDAIDIIYVDTDPKSEPSMRSQASGNSNSIDMASRLK